MSLRLQIAALMLALCALSSAQVAAPPAPVVSRARDASTTSSKATLPKEIHWARDSAEYKACMIQAYQQAAAVLKSKSGELTSGTWAVVLDADETVIDNSQYQKEMAAQGKSYDSAAWKAWCERCEAKVLPGARTFLKSVHDLGGKIVIVTNRSTAEQPVTERNFHNEAIPYDLMLCKSGSGEKEARSQAVESGTAAPGVPPLKIVMWVGDNVQDFPNQRQAIRTGDESAFADFGTRYIVLPNPMYGSWERNPER